jgi:hypothetical protein
MDTKNFCTAQTIREKTQLKLNSTKCEIGCLLEGEEGDSYYHQIELSDDEIKTIIALLRFSIDACPENLPEHKIEIDTVNNLISKFEHILK